MINLQKFKKEKFGRIISHCKNVKNLWKYQNVWWGDENDHKIRRKLWVIKNHKKYDFWKKILFL